MTDIDADLEGALDLMETLDEMQDDVESTATWVTGSGVEYSIYLEMGTRNMDPKPTFRPAAREAEADLETFVATNTETTVQAVDDVDKLVKVVAFALERRIKELIEQKGLIDTGAFRASVKAVPKGGTLLGLSDVAARADVDLDPAGFE